MRTPFAVILMLSLLLGGTYWYTSVEAACQLPLKYRIGSVDEQFQLSFEEARLALVDAEAVWENATGKNLFDYDDDAEFTINFVFDERQALADAEEHFRERLDATEGISEAIDETYAALVKQYNDLSIRYKEKVEAYERELSAYNAEVESYNQSGGAPPEVYDELAVRKEELDREQTAINDLAEQLNELVSEINRIGERGNQLIDIHNQEVERYNETFGGSREFTQGDYYRKEINIYTFEDRTELITVLVHEFGHALSLGHVENEESVMYYLMGGQTDPLTLTEEDVAEFEAVCANDGAFSVFTDMKEWFSR